MGLCAISGNCECIIGEPRFRQLRPTAIPANCHSGQTEDAGFFLYYRRAWVKDPCWENSRWHSLSYRAIDEFEYVYIFWKPGISVIDRNRLSKEEWIEWGSRAVWKIPSVRSNSEHEAQFPLELPRRVIRIFSGKDDLVIDPFMGLGTTAVAAIREERRYIGIDYVPDYVEKAAARIALGSAR